MTAIARLISILFHPLLMATYLFILFAFVFPIAFDPIKEEGTWRFIFLLFSVTFVLPLIMVGMLKTMGLLDSLHMYERKQRLLPFVLISAFYTGITYVFFDRAEVSINDNFLKFLVIINLLVLASTVVTFFFKASIHAIAAWGFIGILIPLNGVSDSGALLFPTIGAIALAGVIMWARMMLHVHTLREVIVGGFLGFVTSFSAMHVLFRY